MKFKTTVVEKKMFSRAKVRVSEKSYRYSVPVIYLMRLMGIFPVAIHRDKMRKLYMQWSPLYASYSYILGLFLQSTAYMGMFKDLLADHSESVRVRSRTDVFVNFGDVTATQIVTFSGIFVIPTKFLVFFQYVRYINEVDAIIHTKHSKWEKLKTFCSCYGVLLAIFTFLSGDYLMYVFTVGKKLGAFSPLLTYSTYYITCMILMITEYEFQYMASSLRKRIKRLNHILKGFDVLVTNRTNMKSVPWKTSVGEVKKTNFTINNPGGRIDLLMRAYLKLVKAADCQNSLLGATGAVAIIAGFWHLITAAYFLLSELSGKRRDPVFIAMKVLWCFFHTGRLLMVIEPWYGCHEEAETTKNLVCKLQCSQVDRTLKKRLRYFQLILALRGIDFSLAGLAVIDRALITSVLGTTTTYLVILLQYEAEDTD